MAGSLGGVGLLVRLRVALQARNAGGNPPRGGDGCEGTNSKAVVMRPIDLQQRCCGLSAGRSIVTRR